MEFSLKWLYWPKSEVKKTFYLLTSGGDRRASLETRRLKLSLQYYMKMKANPENPAYSCVVSFGYKTPNPIWRTWRWISTQLALCSHQSVHLGFFNSLIYFLTSQITGRETPVPLSSRACCWSYFVEGVY